MSPETATAIEAVKEAGRMLLSAPHPARTLRRKPSPDGSCNSRKGFVTEMDVACENLFRNVLLGAFPEYGFWGEEGTPLGAHRGSVWVVDPLDGTLAYGRGLDTYATAVALVREGSPVLGVVYCPASGELFQAERGKGAFLNGERIRVSPEERLEDAVVSMDHRIFRSDDHPLATRDLVRTIRRLRVAESCSQELCHLASGRIDAVVRTLQPTYDFLMGLVIVEEAGGVIADFEGRALPTIPSHARRTNVLAGTASVVAAIRSYLAPSAPPPQGAD